MNKWTEKQLILHKRRFKLTLKKIDSFLIHSFYMKRTFILINKYKKDGHGNGYGHCIIVESCMKREKIIDGYCYYWSYNKYGFKIYEV